MPTLEATGAPRLSVGINYPWGFNKYGLYFGPHWREGEAPCAPELDNWLFAFEENLRIWRAMGVSVVRIFLLCNLQNLGTTSKGRWLLPSKLDPLFLDHLLQMLDRARSASIQLIPSLVDFGIGNPDCCGSREGRTSIVTQENARAAFFELVLGPFLEASKSFREQIYAWEVMNEPSWLCSFWWPFRLVPRLPCATRAQLSAFLSQGLGLIDSAGFPSTVGHRYLRDLNRLPTGTVPQYHFYARPWRDPARIPPCSRLPLPNTLIGEFSVRDGPEGGAWKWLKGSDGPTLQARVRERLLELERLGYGLALLWPDDAPFTINPPSDPKISREVAEGILSFTRSQPRR